MLSCMRKGPISCQNRIYSCMEFPCDESSYKDLLPSAEADSFHSVDLSFERGFIFVLPKYINVNKLRKYKTPIYLSIVSNIFI